MAAITVAVYLQGLKLAQMEKQVVETAWLGSKESELRHYVSLAYSAVAPLQEAGDDRPRASGAGPAGADGIRPRRLFLRL